MIEILDFYIKLGEAAAVSPLPFEFELESESSVNFV